MTDNNWDITVEDVYKNIDIVISCSIDNNEITEENLDNAFILSDNGYIRKQLNYLNEGLGRLCSESDSKDDLNIWLTRLKEEILIGLYVINKYMKLHGKKAYAMVNSDSLYMADINEFNKVIYYKNGNTIESRDLDFINTSGSMYSIDNIE
ncbi:hypothetical protein ACSW8S_19735 (plasmid) [Clostridium perfringens]